MFKVVILYAPQDASVRKFADCVQKAFDRKQFKATTTGAGKAHVPDIAAVDAVIFGSRAENGINVHADFTELMRAFSGVNFAGRCAAFFADKGSGIAGEFARALADSEISVFSETLAFQEKATDTQKIKRWVDQYSTFIRKNVHE
ncbi:MAG: flavodoxin family protein [Spirochaetales bacterium]|nr:flavodoxin family protein [Spirochaetales bacterium]